LQFKKGGGFLGVTTLRRFAKSTFAWEDTINQPVGLLEINDLIV
jgi:hypothetical protein